MSQISPSTSFTYFMTITLGAFVIKYFVAKGYKTRNSGGYLGLIITVCYLAIIIGNQLYINYQNAKDKCGGTPQLIPAINYTLIPNIFIFGLLLLILIIMPGWKAPFSNTIGYVCVWLFGINNTLFKILKQDDGQSKLLQMVYDDPSTLVNEITPENFDLFIARMDGKKGGTDEIPVVNAVPVEKAALKGGRKKQRGGNRSILNAKYRDHLPELYKFVVIKDMISEILWYGLVGNLVINTSNSYIQTIKCNRNADALNSFVEDSLNNPKKEKKKEKWSLGF